MPERPLPRLAVLISGRGSNMAALLAAMAEGRIPAVASVVVSNVADAPGLAIARARGVLTEVVEHARIKPREAHENAVAEVLRRHGADWICLAGYMRRLSPSFLAAFPGRVVNVHPSLLPSFPGLDAQKAALAHGVKVTGCTVHLVDEELDHGPIVVQRAVPVRDGDTVASLSARILEEEHRAYAEAMALLVSGRARVEGRRVVAVS